MNILHTSDWHLGHTLHGHKRHEEFSLFLSWLHEIILREHVDLLLVAGDIFDNASPGTQAQELYYDFLHRITASTHCHVVITSGNHDSPAFLDAPQQLLEHLRVHIIGRARAPEEEVLKIPGEGKDAGVLVCAVPFLRERELYHAEAGDTPEERDVKLAEGLYEHYSQCAAAAEAIRAGRDIPLIAMGHLFVQGGSVHTDQADSIRIGTLARVDAGMFCHAFDYVALGHLHIPQKVHQQEMVRYSGSPLPMDFQESKDKKSVCLLHTQGRKISVQDIAVPTFRELVCLEGDWEELERQFKELAQSSENPEHLWAEVLYTGQEIIGNLREKVLQTAPEHVDVLRIRNARTLLPSMQAEEAEGIALQDMTEADVFARRLRDSGLDTEETEDQRKDLMELHAIIVREIKESLGDAHTCES